MIESARSRLGQDEDARFSPTALGVDLTRNQP